MRVRVAWTWALTSVVVASVGWAAACGSNSGASQFPAPVDAGSTVDTSAPPFVPNEAGTITSPGAVVVSPANATLVVTGAGTATEAYTATIVGSSSPLTNVAWSIDLPLVGTIAQNGLFTATGNLGGQVDVTATTPSGQGATLLTVLLKLTDSGSVSSTTQTQLEAGGTADAAFTWLYPYDQTVFPLGLQAPVLQFGGEAATAMMLHVTSTTLDYTIFLGAADPAQMALTDAQWTTITESAAAGDPLTIAVTKLSAKGVTGPITESWTVAPGSLKGSVYYDTYDSTLNSGSGAVMRVHPGQDATILIGGCSVCHSVSANGSRIVTMGSTLTRNPDGGNDYYYYQRGQTQLLTDDAGAARTEADPYLGFGALYPDGTVLLSEGSMDGNWPPNLPGFGEINYADAGGITDGGYGDRPSRLVDPNTGALLDAPGFDGVVTHALMPAFSPDGTKVVFNHYDEKSDAGQGHTLAVMSFERANNSFSNLVDLVTLGPTEWAAWPYFTPDSQSVVFNVVDYADYATWDDLGRNNPPHSDKGDLQIVDLATQTVTPLNAANGVLADGGLSLPYGAEEAHMNYEPTTLPVAVGGYYWVVFTSRREYGNTICDATGDSNAYENHPAKRKKLWVAAIDLNATPGKDPSHPAFYLSGQELAAGNMRGFWALDPCQQNGSSCSSGDQCCTGFCRETSTSSGGEVLSCVPQPVGCSNEFEKCTTSANCCGAAQGYECLNGFCAQPAPK